MEKRKIVVGICGSVAAIETPKIVREFRRRGIEVECVMTNAAREIISENVLEWASGNRVIKKLTGSVEHVRLCGVDGEASLLLICPATANTISKIANGIDDTTVTTFATTALGSGIPIVMVPAMHISIYQNPFVSENVERLKDSGIVFIEPRVEEKKAKLADIDNVVNTVLKILKNEGNNKGG